MCKIYGTDYIHSIIVCFPLSSNDEALMYIVGMISGTSADAIEAALVQIHGASSTITACLIKHLSVVYSPLLQHDIFTCFRPESSSVDRLSRLNVALGEAYAA